MSDIVRVGVAGTGWWAEAMTLFGKFSRLLVCAVSFSATAVPPAAAQDPSPEQCTCDLAGFPDRTGADVVNAASCLLELRHPWCDIYLASLENTEAHETVVTRLNDVSAGDSAHLEGIMLEMFDGYLQSIPDRAEQMADTYGSDRKFIEEMTEKYTEVLSSCIKVFIERSDIVLGDGPVICAVGDQSGWLKIRFDTGERTYLFLFAPSS